MWKLAVSGWLLAVGVAMATGAWADETERAANGVLAKERLEVDGTLELAGEIAAGMDEGDETVVSATNLVLVGNVTVGAVAEGSKGRAILTFSSIETNDYQITLTSNGVVRSIGPEPVDVSAVFAPTAEGTVVVTRDIYGASANGEDDSAAEEGEGPDPEKDPGAGPLVVGYEYRLVNGKQVSYVRENFTSDSVACERITDAMTDLAGGWYYVEDRNLIITHGLRIGRQNVRIILCDGCCLTVNARPNETAIEVMRHRLRNGRLYIYGQGGQSGRLIVRGGRADENALKPHGVAGNGAGIGGQVIANERSGNDNCCGNVYIYGGTVEAYGAPHAAGIGGAYVNHSYGYGWGDQDFHLGALARVKAVGGEGAAGVGGCHNTGAPMPSDAGAGATHGWFNLYNASQLEVTGGNGAPAIGHGRGSPRDPNSTLYIHTVKVEISQQINEGAPQKQTPGGSSPEWTYICNKKELPPDYKETLRILAYNQEPIPYWNAETKSQCYLLAYKPLESSSSTVTLDHHGRYYVKDNVTINGGIVLGGYADIVIADGKTLTVNGRDVNRAGIQVRRGHTWNDRLTIYGQMVNGTVNAKVVVQGGKNGAGIGGDPNHADIWRNCGNVYLHGLQIEATGGENAAGIGSSYNTHRRYGCGDLCLYGESVRVKATGGAGAQALVGAKDDNASSGRKFFIYPPSCTLKAKENASAPWEQIMPTPPDTLHPYFTAYATQDQYVEIETGGTLPDVTYAFWDEDEGVFKTGKKSGYTLLVAAPRTPLADGAWYYVKDDFTAEKGITLVNDAYIIIAAGKTLKVNGRENEAGIQVRRGSIRNDNLCLFSQTGGTVGKVIVRGGRNGAGIGGDPKDTGSWIDCGNVYVHGVQVQAFGGENAPGIGGSYRAQNSGNRWGTLCLYGLNSESWIEATAGAGAKAMIFAKDAKDPALGKNDTYTVEAPAYKTYAGRSSASKKLVACGAGGTSHLPPSDPFVRIECSDDTLESVSYWDWDPEKEEMSLKTTSKFGVIGPETRQLESGKFYVVRKNTVCNGGLFLEKGVAYANAHIIIKDDVTLTVKGGRNEPGVMVRRGFFNDSLHIHGGLKGSGKLVATGGENGAGIGGACTDECDVPDVAERWPWIDGGNIYVYNAQVEATGGENAAGIGGSYFVKSDKTALAGNRLGALMLYGDKTTVEATGGEGANALVLAKDPKPSIGMIVDDFEVRATSCDVEVGLLGEDLTLPYNVEGFAGHFSALHPIGKFVRIACGGAREPLKYMDWDPAAGKLVEKTVTDYQVLGTPICTLQDGGWYVVRDDSVVPAGIVAGKNTHIVVSDGVSLTAQGPQLLEGIVPLPGISASKGDSIHLHGQAKGTGRVFATGSAGCPGIGATEGISGAISVHGLNVTATGGEGAPGIGAHPVNGSFGEGLSVYGVGVGAWVESIAGSDDAWAFGKFAVDDSKAFSASQISVYGANVQMLAGGNRADVAEVSPESHAGNAFAYLLPQKRYAVIRSRIEREEISYMEWDASASKTVERKTRFWTPLEEDAETLFNHELYVVEGKLNFDYGLRVEGAVGIVLKDGATLTVTGDDGEAGIEVSAGNALAIYGQALGTGALAATGGEDGAGIGGGSDCSGGQVEINGGRVTAIGKGGAKGIGAGCRAGGGAVGIFGGTVEADGWNGQGLGGAVTIGGGSVMTKDCESQPKNARSVPVYRVTVKCPGLEGRVRLDGLGDYGTSGIYPMDGRVYLWLPDGTHRFTLSDGATAYRYCAVVNGVAITVEPLAPVGFFVNGVDVGGTGSGDGWKYQGQVLTLNSQKMTYVLSGEATDNKVQIKADAFDATVILSNAVVFTSGCPALDIAQNVTLLMAGGASFLTAAANDAAAVAVAKDAKLAVGLAPDANRNEAMIGTFNSGSAAAIAGEGSAVVKGGTLFAWSDNPAVGLPDFTCNPDEIMQAGDTPEGMRYATDWRSKRCVLVGPAVTVTVLKDIPHVSGFTVSNAVQTIDRSQVPQGDTYRVMIGDDMFIGYTVEEGYTSQSANPLVYADVERDFTVDAQAIRILQNIPYRAWNETTRRMEDRLCTDYTVVTADTMTFGRNGWYVVRDPVVRGSIAVSGAAHLILCDGATLTVSGDKNHAGLAVEKGNSLTIYGQASGTGELIAQGGASDPMVGTGKGGGSGIGGGYKTDGGTVTINGGVITAKGGGLTPGIGGGFASACGTVTINGGLVKASGGWYGSGIGTGCYCTPGGRVTINGGTVVARGGSLTASDIGCKGKDIDIVIRGGSVKAEKIENAPKNVGGDPLYRVTVKCEGLKAERLMVEGLDGYGTNDIYAVEGRIYLWLPRGTHYFTVSDGGTTYRYCAVVKGIAITVEPLGPVGFFVNGEDIGVTESGTGWDYIRDSRRLMLWPAEPCAYVLSGMATNDEVGVEVMGSGATVILSNAVVFTSGRPALQVNSSATLLMAGGTSYLAATNDTPAVRIAQGGFTLAVGLAPGADVAESMVGVFNYSVLPAIDGPGTSVAVGGGTLAVWADKQASLPNLTRTADVFCMLAGGDPETAKIVNTYNGEPYVFVTASVAPVTPGTPIGPFTTPEAATNAAKKAVLVPRDDVVAALGTDEALETYCNMFGFAVTGGGSAWSVEATLYPEPWTNVVESAQEATQQIPVGDIAALPTDGKKDVSVTNCVPGFYYTLYGAQGLSALPTTGTAYGPKLSGVSGEVTFPEVTKPSDKAGFFSIGVKEAPDVTPSDSIVVIPPKPLPR